MASSSTTTQISALEQVYRQFADADNNNVKKKLAATAKDNRSTKFFVKKSCKMLKALKKNMKKSKDTGVRMSADTVQTMIQCLDQAHTVILLLLDNGTDFFHVQ